MSGMPKKQKEMNVKKEVKEGLLEHVKLLHHMIHYLVKYHQL
jgi:hypothetical protein